MREIPPTGATERDRDFAINQLIRGGGNQAGVVTLAINVTTTTVTKTTIRATASPQLTAATLNAAAALATTFVSAVGAGSFTITHASNAQADRTFYYTVVGG